MTRILYWNVNNFSRSKIFREAPPQAYQESMDRLDHMVNQVLAPHPPDVFIVVEAFARVREVGFQGTTLNTDSPVSFGVLLLLDEIRQRLGDTWCVVPPLAIGNFGYREAVAVYYNAATLTFAGPWVYSRPTVNDVRLSRSPTPANLAGIQNYEPDWLDGLPSPHNPIHNLQQTRTWLAPNGAPVNEWQGAGQWAFVNNQGATMKFPDADNRSPFYTRFRDAAGRTIRLFAVHTSPASAVDATVKIGAIPEVNTFSNNEVTVVIGDFNVDSFDMSENGAYDNLVASYECVLEPRVNHVVQPARKPYCMTHLLPLDLATPFNNTGVPSDPQHNVYPRRGYMGSVDIDPRRANDSGAIDNAFVRVQGLPAVPRNTTIVNTVAGKPYTQVAPPPNVTAELTGGNPYASSLANPIPAAGINPPVDTIGLANWGNLGKIYSTSDHLALSIDV